MSQPQRRGLGGLLDETSSGRTESVAPGPSTLPESAGSGARSEDETRRELPVRKRPVRRRARAMWVDVALVFGLVGIVCWGGWVTKSLLGSQQSPHFVKLQLQGIISEYLQAQARSGNSDIVAAQETAHFMGVLDKAVAEAGSGGSVVLVNEAVIGGSIPDVTAQIRRKVYAQVAMPSQAAAPVNEQPQGDAATMMSQGAGNGDAQ